MVIEVIVKAGNETREEQLIDYFLSATMPNLDQLSTTR